MAIITTSRAISGQLMLITPGREASATQLFIHLTPVSRFASRQRFLRALPKCERTCIAGKESMEERLPPFWLDSLEAFLTKPGVEDRSVSSFNFPKRNPHSLRG